MTWEQRPAAIVMITQLMEQGRPKCAPYWPEDIGGDPIEFSPGLSVVAVSATTHNGYTKTMLRVTKGGESFDVVRFPRVQQFIAGSTGAPAHPSGPFLYSFMPLKIQFQTS